MGRNTQIILYFLLFISGKVFAQQDAFTGTWEGDAYTSTGVTPFHISLQIATAERGLLYPASLAIQYKGFSAEYGLLLVKKSARELAISKNKFPLSESFSTGEWPVFLNGIFDLGKNFKGVPTLSSMRIASRQDSKKRVQPVLLKEGENDITFQVRDLFRNAEINLIKIHDKPWEDAFRDTILNPVLSPLYFGIKDTIIIIERDGMVNLASNKKRKKDVVSIGLNGNLIIDKIPLYKKKYVDDILLDTGLNILTLFAENFGNDLPNTAQLQVELGKRKFSLDFTTPADSAATVIVARIIYGQDIDYDTYFQNHHFPGIETHLQADEKLISSIVTQSSEVTFAIWDDALEDGDSISLVIEGKYIAAGYPVKKAPQFISVKLQPGPNTIVFMADNVGSIPPNTSVLEIIDGKKRKSFTMETNPGEKNLIKIFYDTNKGL